MPRPWTWGMATLLVLLAALLGWGFVPSPRAGAAVRASLPTPTPPAPPTRVPPTAVPPTAAPPSATPAAPEATPVATTRPRPPDDDDDDDPEPTATLLPPTATPAPTAAPPPPSVNVRIAKTVDQGTRVPGQTAVYTLVATNDGPGTASDVVVSDTVPDAVRIIDLDSSKGDVVADGPTVTAYPRTLAPGETVTVRITVQVRPDAAPGSYPNTGIVTTSSPGDGPGDNASTVDLVVPAPAPAAAPPRRLPVTADDRPWLLTLPPFGYVALIAVLLVAVGLLVRRRATPPGGALSVEATSAVWTLPPVGPLPPPQLGPALPPLTDPTPLPPLRALDRDAALADALPEEG